jgi:hypothetical protein
MVQIGGCDCDYAGISIEVALKDEDGVSRRIKCLLRSAVSNCGSTTSVDIE